MPIDPSIILRGQGVQLDNPMDTMAKGMSLKQLAMQSRTAERTEADDKTLRDAYQKNTSAGPDGKISLNRTGVLADLTSAGLGQKAMDLQSGFAKQDAEVSEQQMKVQLDQAKMKKQLMWSVTDPTSYVAARERAIALKLPNADKLPPSYPGDQIMRRFQMGTLDAEAQEVAKWKQKEFDQNERKIKAVAGAQVAKAGKVSPTQAKQQGLYQQGILAEKQYNEAVSGTDSRFNPLGNHYDPSSSGNWIDKNDWAPKMLKSNEANRAETAQDRWVEAFLRDASGAAIPPSERGAYAKDFFPTAGDSEKIVSDKAAARQAKMQSAKYAAGEKVDFSSEVEKLPDDQIDLLYGQLGGK